MQLIRICGMTPGFKRSTSKHIQSCASLSTTHFYAWLTERVSTCEAWCNAFISRNSFACVSWPWLQTSSAQHREKFHHTPSLLTFSDDEPLDCSHTRESTLCAGLFECHVYICTYICMYVYISRESTLCAGLFECHVYICTYICMYVYISRESCHLYRRRWTSQL